MSGWNLGSPSCSLGTEVVPLRNCWWNYTTHNRGLVCPVKSEKRFRTYNHQKQGYLTSTIWLLGTWWAHIPTHQCQFFLPTSVGERKLYSELKINSTPLVWRKRLCSEANLNFCPPVWKKEAMIWVENEFLPTSAVAKGYVHVWSQTENSTTAKIVPFIGYLSLWVM